MEVLGIIREFFESMVMSNYLLLNVNTKRIVPLRLPYHVSFTSNTSDLTGKVGAFEVTTFWKDEGDTVHDHAQRELH